MVSYLGHVKSEAGIHTDPNKIIHIQNCLIPNSIQGVRNFLGFGGYYHGFIKDFASIFLTPLKEKRTQNINLT